MSSIFSEGENNKAKKNMFTGVFLCSEIATSVGGLKKHIYSHIKASEEKSEKGYKVSSTSALVKAHTLPHVGHSRRGEC